MPDITPVAVSIDSPAGSAPEIEYVVLVGEAAAMETLIGAIADPTVPVSLAFDNETASGVVNVVTVEDVPTPPLFVAVVVTE